MSHGPSAEGSNAEPNLTPLLDVVLQLLMFFMMCVNFVTEQVNEDIACRWRSRPGRWTRARPMCSFSTSIRTASSWSLAATDPCGRRGRSTSSYASSTPMRGRLAEGRGDKSGTVNTTIIIRRTAMRTLPTSINCCGPARMSAIASCNSGQ